MYAWTEAHVSLNVLHIVAARLSQADRLGIGAGAEGEGWESARHADLTL